MLSLQNTYSGMTPRRARDLAFISMLEVLVIGAAILYLHTVHVASDARLASYLWIGGITLVNAILVAGLVSMGRAFDACVVYVALLAVRAVVAGLPDNPAQQISPYLVIYSLPIVAADVLLNGRVAGVMAALMAVAIASSSALNAAGLLPVKGHSAPAYLLVLFSIAVLVGNGALLGIFAGEPYVALRREPDDEGESAVPTGGESCERCLSHSELAQVLSLTMRLGSLMLASGAASFRAEQVMSRVAETLGVERLDTYVTPGGIVASAYSGTEHRTQTVRIPRVGVAMDRVVALEKLSHGLLPTQTPAQVLDEVRRIEKSKPNYPDPVLMLAAGVACGALALVMGGGWKEFVAAGVGALVAQGVRIRMTRALINPIMTTFFCSAIATAISIGLVRLIHAPAPRAGVIASPLLLVPGVPLVTSILDLTRFDLLSGVSRGVQALLLFISIAMGMLIVLVATNFNIL